MSKEKPTSREQSFKSTTKSAGNLIDRLKAELAQAAIQVGHFRNKWAETDGKQRSEYWGLKQQYDEVTKERDELKDVLGLIVAEFNSGPMSVQCFDLRIVKRAKDIVAKCEGRDGK